MKRNRVYLLITLSTIALLTVLIIQVSWILQTAKAKETLFNERARLVLTRTAEALRADTTACRNLHIDAGVNEKPKIDSLFRHYLALYNFHIDYYFEVNNDTAKGTTAASISPFQQNCYQACVDENEGPKSLQLKLVLPGKKQFILQEMGVPFITSVILILVVLVLSWRTTLSLIREQRISAHTRDFLNNMTHEFKTPITNISLAGKMIARDMAVSSDEKAKHYTNIILEENEKLRLQVEQVLSMTALERGEIPLQLAEVNVHLLIGEVLKNIGLQLESKGGQAKLELEATHFIVRGDRLHLANALSNLVDNAIRYSPEKTEITIRTYNRDGKLLIIIADKGIGIEPQYHQRVFEKYFRVPTGDVHDVKGFGLGLSYTKEIISLHNGTISLQSAKDKGSTFTIILPYV